MKPTPLFMLGGVLLAVYFTNRTLEKIMNTIEQKTSELGAKMDANNARTAKALAEIKAGVSKGTITQADLEAAVEAAKAGQKITDETEFNALLEKAFAPLVEKAAIGASVAEELDNLNIDDVTDGGEPAPVA